VSYYDDMNEMTREGGAPSKDGGEAMSSQHCPDHPDFGLLDKALHGLDGALGGDMLPLDKVVPDVDLLSVAWRDTATSPPLTPGHQNYNEYED